MGGHSRWTAVVLVTFCFPALDLAGEPSAVLLRPLVFSWAVVLFAFAILAGIVVGGVEGLKKKKQPKVPSNEVGLDVMSLARGGCTAVQYKKSDGSKKHNCCREKKGGWKCYEPNRVSVPASDALRAMARDDSPYRIRGYSQAVDQPTFSVLTVHHGCHLGEQWARPIPTGTMVL